MFKPLQATELSPEEYVVLDRVSDRSITVWQLNVMTRIWTNTLQPALFTKLIGLLWKGNYKFYLNFVN